jgi:hypothetical protein
MNFLRRLFASKVNDDFALPENSAISHSSTSNSYRFSSQPLTDEDKEKTIHIIKSYLEHNQLQIPDSPLCHPTNLDFMMQQSNGFANHYLQRGMTIAQLTEHLSNATCIYLTDHCGYKRYEDSLPESPQRAITLKCVKGQIVVSIYPFEFCETVLNSNSTFVTLLERI